MIRRVALTAFLVSVTATAFSGSRPDEMERVLERGQELDTLHEACAKKEADACSRLADIYVFGGGVALRPEKAREFLRGICALDRHAPDPCLAAAVGLACRRLAQIYERGEGTKKEELFAAGYDRIGSKRGDAVSSVALSRMLEAGTPLPKDLARAHAPLRLACGQANTLSTKCGMTEARVSEYQKVATEACESLHDADNPETAPSEWTADAADGTLEVCKPGEHGISEPRKIHEQVPSYPRDARSARVQGKVLLRAFIDVDGHVVDLTVVSSPNESLTKAAIATVWQWVYAPTLVDGMPLPTRMTVTVTFRLS
jgi:TonB family protein